jgi:uncharacterized protein with LGFP repeats
VRRFIGGSAAFLVLTGTLLVLPVYAAPAPTAHPVETSIDEVALGSVVDPEPAAVVTTDGEAQTGGVPESEATVLPGEVPAAGTQPAPTDAPATTPPAEATDTPSTTESSPSDEDAATSGAELAGVPALTVSRPDTEPFSSVGVTWALSPDVTDVVVQVRAHTTASGWGEWTTLEPDDIEQTDSAATTPEDVRGGTAPYWTGPSDGVEAIVQSAEGTVPQDVRLALVDPGTSSADALPLASGVQDQAQAGTSMPSIVSRAGWGADDSIRTWDPEYAPTIKAATIHHTADSNNYTAAQVPAMMRSIYAFHTQGRGWGDIGYNVIVDKYGRIFEGRYGGLSSTVIGAHAGGFNSNTFGVSMLGNYAETDTPQAMLDSVASVIAWKLALYGVNPYGTTQLTSGGGGTSRYPAGAVVTLPTIFAHRDVGSTTCPGQYAYNRMGQIRDMVAARSGPTGGSPVGNVETLSVTGNRLDVAGWTYDQDLPTSSIDVGVSVDGAWVLSLRADRSRPDVAAAIPAAGAAHGFTGSTTLSPGKHQVCVVFVNGGPTGSNTWMRCQQVTASNVAVTKNPVGNLEGAVLDGRTIRLVGWTVDPDALASTLDVHVYVNGRNVSMQPAGVDRPDVGAAFPGAGAAHGFTWSGAVDGPGDQRVCVYAINRNVGTENPVIGCATIAVPAALFAPVGHLDEATVVDRVLSVRGWALDPDVPAQSLGVHLYVDGSYVAAVTADRARPDVEAAWAGAGAAHGFATQVTLAPGAHTVCALALNAGPGTYNPGLGCAVVTVTARAWEPVGNLDEVRSLGTGQILVRGWTWDPDAGPSSNPVHVYVDGVNRAMFPAAADRPDVAAALPGAGPGHGFSTTLSVGPGRHTVCAYGINVGTGSTNPQLACRTVVV